MCPTRAMIALVVLPGKRGHERDDLEKEEGEELRRREAEGGCEGGGHTLRAGRRAQHLAIPGRGEQHEGICWCLASLSLSLLISLSVLSLPVLLFPSFVFSSLFNSPSSISSLFFSYFPPMIFSRSPFLPLLPFSVRWSHRIG